MFLFLFLVYYIKYNEERNGEYMKVYNSLTRTVEEFIPRNGNIVNLYTCGPTVYHFAHIGNLRTYIFEDILEKGLSYVGYDVKRVMNITDVGHMTNDSDTGDDKMLQGAKREHKTVYEIADFYTQAFFADTEKLNITKPKIVEKASDHIEFYIKMIEKLLKDGFAYVASNSNVYFDVQRAGEYYKLSGKNSEDLLVGARDAVEEDEFKKSPYDFGLWFTTSRFDNQAMQWDSPWGRGYPGWHIECSGISIQFLGEYLDIHCGGVDNIFPHHTNEIAQSEAYLGHKWCSYWMHGEHLNDMTGKMSKSSGDFLTLSLLIEKGYNPLEYRLFCLQSHYRKQLVFSYDGLDNTKSIYNKLVNKISVFKDEEKTNKDNLVVYQNDFKKAIENDLNTSSMLTVLYDVLKSDLNDSEKLYLIKDFDKVLGLDLVKKEVEIEESLLSYINERIEARNQAKANKDFELSDMIRKELEEKNVIIKDTREGTIFQMK